MTKNQIVDGLLVINKLRGMTSLMLLVEYAVLLVKSYYAGTLDPNVDGVLVVALGKGQS